MYNITFCRLGSYTKPNKGIKGTFKKEFKTLSEFTSFFIRSRQKLYLPYIRKELSKKEIIIFQNKFNCLINKS